MNVTEKVQKLLINRTVGPFRLFELIAGGLILIAFALISFFVVLSVKKAIQTSLNSHPTGVTSVKLGTISLPTKVETSGNSATSSLKLSDFVSAETFAPAPPNDEYIVSSLAYSSSPKQLEAPILSHQSGYYEGIKFPINLKITNPNDLTTWLMVSKNGGQFAKFEGQTLTIRPEDIVEAYVRGDTQRWHESQTVRGRYRSKSWEGARSTQVPVHRIKFQH